MNRLWKFRRTVGVIVLSVPCTLVAEVPADDAPPDARQILHNMTQTLAQAPGFSVSICSNYDAIQADGQRIEFQERRQVQLQRPGHLRIDATRSDGDAGMLLFDGKAITAFKANDNVYARVQKPGTVDTAVVYLAKELQHQVPLARLLLTTLPQELESQIEFINYVEKNVLQDTPTDHLAMRLAEVDVQVWVAQGEQPLPRRIVITYRNEPGQPQFRADLKDWRLTAPGATSTAFTWVPPATAEQIPFLAPVPMAIPVPGDTPVPETGSAAAEQTPAASNAGGGQ